MNVENIPDNSSSLPWGLASLLERTKPEDGERDASEIANEAFEMDCEAFHVPISEAWSMIR